MKFYVTKIKNFIIEKLLENLFFAHRRLAEEGSVNSLIALTKFILKFGEKFEDELIYFDKKDKEEEKNKEDYDYVKPYDINKIKYY